MAYADRYGMIGAFGEAELIQRTDRAEPPTGEIDDDVLDSAITDATSVIDGYLGGVYALPIAGPSPDPLPRLCKDIARYMLYDDMVPETIQQRYDAAIALLKDIASRKFALPLPLTTANATSAGAAEISGGERVMSRDSLKSW